MWGNIVTIHSVLKNKISFEKAIFIKEQQIKRFKITRVVFKIREKSYRK
jgi:hypothetical protein